jgi:DNA-binding MarR family transcriptional regulator
MSNDVRQAIVILLSEEDRLRFSDIQTKLEIAKPDLAFHLNRLIQAGLVSRVYPELPAEESRAYYRLSELGQKLLHGIADAFLPPVPPVTLRRENWTTSVLFADTLKGNWIRFAQAKERLLPTMRGYEVKVAYPEITHKHSVFEFYVGSTVHEEWETA